MEESPSTALKIQGELARKRAGPPPDLPSISSGDVKVEWALVGGKPVNVRNVPEGAEDSCLCLGCDHRLIPRRGRKTAWHFGHEKGSPECPLHSELVLKRFLAMMHLKEILDDMSSLEVEVTCWSNRSGGVPHMSIFRSWLSGWDEVLVGSRRHGLGSELVLAQGGRSIGSIHLQSSTPVGTRQEEELRELGVSWVEVSVNRVLEWMPDLGPLPVHRLEPGSWLCPICQAYTRTTETRLPQGETYEARLGELRDQGLLRLLWARSYTATFGGRSWPVELQICDLVDDRGLPLHRLLVDASHGVLLSAVSVEDLVTDVKAVRTLFKEGWSRWVESLEVVGVELEEAGAGWRHVAEKVFLYDTDEARARLRAERRHLRHPQDPKVVAACAVLGVAPGVGVRELRSARNTLAKKWHPDRAQAKDKVHFTAKMRAINMAFDLLSSLQRSDGAPGR